MLRMAFNQALINTAVVRETDLKNLFAELEHEASSSGDRRASYTKYLDEAKILFQKIGRTIHNVRHPLTNEILVCITVEQDRSPQNLAHREKLQELLRLLFDKQRHYCIKRKDLARDERESDALVEEYMWEGWIERLQVHDLTVFIPTARLLIEAEPYIEEFGVPRCLGCKQFMLYGHFCSNEDCDAALHRTCYDSYYTVNSATPGLCVKCGSNMLDANNDNIMA